MFRAILAENSVDDTDVAILEQEVVMFFKLSEWHLRAITFKLTVSSAVHIESSWASPVTPIRTLQQVAINYRPPFASRATVNLLPTGILSSENRFSILLSKLSTSSTFQP